MALIKYTISVVKENPLLKIKVTGIYNEKGQDIYYQNPITGGWARIPGGEENGNLVATQGLSVEFVKKLVSCLKNLADRFTKRARILAARYVETAGNRSLHGALRAVDPC